MYDNVVQKLHSMRQKDLGLASDSTQGIVGSPFSHLGTVEAGQIQRKARKIAVDLAHVEMDCLCCLLPESRKGNIKTQTTRLRDSFFPQSCGSPTPITTTQLHQRNTHRVTKGLQKIELSLFHAYYLIVNYLLTSVERKVQLSLFSNDTY